MIENANKQTVLIAMTGGLESTVVAYLLKKQGYKCIGIGFQLFNVGEDAGPFSEVVVSDLGKVKSICNFLDIPFYAVNATEQFADAVLDPVVGRILSGQTFEPLVFLNLVLMDILIEKAAKFNTKLIASGHYAKVLKNQKSGAFELLVANDLEHDQSYLLSRLGQKHLENLLLPLSEVRKKDVEKIGELIKVELLQRPKSTAANIMRDPRMITLVEARSPKDLRRTGSIFDFRESGSICEHTGIHRFHVGQNKIPSKTELPIDPLKEVISIVPFKGNIFLDFPDSLKYSHALIGRFSPAANLDMTLPISVFVKMSYNGAKVPCKIYFKNNDYCVVDFEAERPGLLVAGQFFAFYSRANDKGKIIGSGIVDTGGVFADGEFNTLPIHKRESDDEEKKVKPQYEKVRF